MAGQISNFRLFLHKISDELGSDEVESLKFICHDNLTKARLEKIKTSKELFVAIGEVTEDEEKQLDLLKQLFKSIYRVDLESRVENFQQTRKGEINQHAPFVTSQQVEDNLSPQVSQTSQPTLRNITGFQQATDSLPGTAKYGESSMASHMSYLPQDIPFRQAHSVVSSPHAYADFTPNSEELYNPRTTEINQHAPFVTSQHVEGNLPPQVNQTGQPTLRNIVGFQQAADSLPNTASSLRTAKYVESSLASHLPQDKPFRESSSAMNPPYAYADSTPNYEEWYKPRTTEQDSASRYQAQYSVPFGEQEQSSSKDESVPNSFSMASSLFKEQHVHEKIEQLHLTDHLQSSPNSFGAENTHHKEVLADEKIKSQDQPQSSSNSMSKLPMATSQGISRDSGQDEVQHGVFDNTDPPTHRGRSWTDGASADTSSDRHQIISQPSAGKVPVERVMSHDYHVEVAQHLNKCPVEMNYNSISKYFKSGGKNLGQGGFGIVYEGIRTFHGQSVVIKEEYTSHVGQPFSAAQLRREKRVGYIKHPHLMPLYAFCEEKGKPRCLMYPKMHSDLHKALRSDLKGHQRLPWENRVRIALHTARALLYLHTEVTNERNVRQEIVHMDVKPGNIFLDEDLNARLGDPGMAQELPMGYSYASISQPRGTDGYMDEYLQDRHLKPVNDVFSFGVVLLQLLTQKRAIEKRPSNKIVPLYLVLKKEGVLSDPERLMKKAQQDVWPVSGDDKRNTKEFAAIAIECLKRPDDRAKLSDVCGRLEEILERKGVSKASKPKEGDRCVSCLLDFPAKYLKVKSHGCDSDITQKCNYFCVTCLSQARRNPLECPSHGPAEPPIGGSDVYAVLVCGNDPSSPKTATIFERDLLDFKSVLTDSRIVGLRNDHVFSIMPSSSCGMSQAHQVRQVLRELKQRLQGKKDVFLYFYFSGHSDQNGNLLCWCSSEDDVLTAPELKEDLKLNVNEFMIILDCCYADGKIASEHIKDDNFLVHKSPSPVESIQHPLESLYNNLQKTVSHEDFVEPVSDASEELPQTSFDTLDGNVLTKAPLGRFTIRQWSSSLSHEESYAKGKGSFFTQFMVCGLRGAHKCQFSNCSSCDRFKAKAKSLGYISAANLEDFVSNHVENAASAADGRHQTPRMRTVHSKETILAFYNEEILCDEIVFRSTSGISERISIDDFPLSLLDFQKLVYSKVQARLPSYAQPKHIQVLCDDQEIDATSYVDLQEFVRQGYDVRCQLRPCSGIVNGPVVIEIQNYKNDVITLLTSLQLTRNQQDLDTFEIDTSKRMWNAEDVRECLEEEPTLNDLRDTSAVKSIGEILTETSVYQGHLVICVLDDSLDCTFTLDE